MMEKKGYIEITISGVRGDEPLTPENYDIRELREFLGYADNLLFPKGSKQRPQITYDIQEGSVKHVLKTSLQAVIAFNAILGQVSERQSIDFLDTDTGKAFEYIQNKSLSNEMVFTISTSIEKSNKLTVDKSTNFVRNDNLWVETELYLYGNITMLGGKTNPSIHIDTEEFGQLPVYTNKEVLETEEKKLLYRAHGLRVKAKKSLETKEFDRRSLELVEVINYDPDYDDPYLQRLINKASVTWRGVDTDVWLEQLRGGYSA